MNDSLQIWQIFFQNEQIQRLDSAFVPLDNRHSTSETHEFAVFQQLLNSGTVAQCGAWGALSWRFHEKTGMRGQTLLDIVRQSPEVDVFYMNPFPHIEGLFASPWWQGEVAHPEFLDIAEAFFVAAGLNGGDLRRLTPSSQFSMCNYFVGRPKFWERYVPFVEEALALAETNMATDLLKKMHSEDADRNKIHHASSYVPFIVERLFTVFLRTQGPNLRFKKIPSPMGEIQMTAALAELREMKDMAVLTRSHHILKMWQTKRAAYFQKTHNIYWCERYLERLLTSPVTL